MKDKKHIPQSLSSKKFPGLDWAQKLKARHDCGEILDPALIELYQRALKMKSSNSI